MNKPLKHAIKDQARNDLQPRKHAYLPLFCDTPPEMRGAPTGTNHIEQGKLGSVVPHSCRPRRGKFPDESSKEWNFFVAVTADDFHWPNTSGGAMPSSRGAKPVSGPHQAGDDP